jgi:hypothetical protein
MHKNMRKKLTKNAKIRKKIDELYTFFLQKKPKKPTKKPKKCQKKDPFRTAISKDLLMAKLEKNASDKAAFSKYFAENSLKK